MNKNIYEFAVESNTIEGIHDEAKHKKHAEILAEFLKIDEITIGDLEGFVFAIQPNGALRQLGNQNVMIGGKMAPPAHISMALLSNLLLDIKENSVTMFDAHCRYEMAHPFMDGNGRSGRALWLWMWVNQYGKEVPPSFLHMFYYQTLKDYSLRTT